MQKARKVFSADAHNYVTKVKVLIRHCAECAVSDNSRSICPSLSCFFPKNVTYLGLGCMQYNKTRTVLDTLRCCVFIKCKLSYFSFHSYVVTIC